MTPALVAPALVDRVRARLMASDAEPTPAQVAGILRGDGIVLGDDSVTAVVGALRAELTGAGPLEPWLAEPGVTDILVNGPDAVWIDRGRGLERVPAGFRDEAAVRRLAQRLAAAVGRRLDDAAPFVDARLADGVRLHAVLPPISPDGTVLSLRVPRRGGLALDDLVALGALPEAAVPVVRALVTGRWSFLVSGGTGSGKTTLLAGLLGLAAPGERLVLVEDSSELRPAHPHVVRLEARPANVEGTGAVTLRDLVRQALRMRPDRLVVGEVRGAEVVDLLTALNTGHEGGCGTIHANSASDVPARLEALGLMAGIERRAVHALVAAGLHAVVHLERGADVVRRVAGIHAIVADGEGGVRAVPAYDFDDRVAAGPGADRLRLADGHGR